MPRRHYSIVAVVVAISVAAASWAEPPLGGPPFSGAATEGLLLLKNGETLPGRITRSGDFYIVTTADSEVQVRLSESASVCRDLEEVLRFKTAQIDVRRPDDHLDLAQWCINHAMYGAAARELAAAIRLDDLNPRIALLERRLKAAMAEPKPPSPAPLPQPRREEDDVLEATARSISPEALQEFSSRVQPLLVNYCAGAGCHGPKATSDFKLQRLYENERSDPRIVRKNLHAALGQVDRANLGSSRLLTVPLQPHGGAKKPVFNAHNAEHYRQLAAWVQRTVATTPAKLAPPTSVAHTTGALLQRLPLAPPSAVAPPTVVPSVPATPISPTPAPSVSPASPPVDPFDPAEFNRRKNETPPPAAEAKP